MATYLIDAENSITAPDSHQTDFEGEIFASEQELAGLADNWPAGRLIEVWNGIPKFPAREVGESTWTVYGARVGASGGESGSYAKLNCAV